MKPKTTFRSCLALSCSTLLAISHSHATNIWDGGGGDGNWNTVANWDNNTQPTSVALTFNGNAQNSTTNDLTAALTYGGINFTNDGSAGKTNPFTLAGASITLGSFGITTTANTAGSTITDIIDLDMILGGTRTITTNQLSNTVQHNLTISGDISGATFGITKAGYGTLTLSGANSYTGATAVSAGKLVLDMASGGLLSATSGLSAAANTQFGTFLVKGVGAGSSAQTLGALGLGNNSGLRIVLDPNGGTGTTLTLGNAWAIGSNSVLLIDYSSASSGTRQVVTAGATTGVTLSNGIYGKVLVKDSTGVLGFGTRAAGVDQAITRYDDATGSTLGVASNSGTLNFTTLNTVYTSGTLTWTNSGVLTNRTVNSLTIDTTNSGGIIDLGVSTNILTLNTGILFKGANDATLTGGRVGSGEVVIHQTGTGTLTINSLVSTGAGLITKNGTGTLVLGGENTITGSITVNEGILKLGAAGNGINTPLGTTGQTTRINSGGALDLNGITLSTAEPLTLNGTGVSNGGALTNSGTNASWSGPFTIQSSSSIIASGGDIALTSATGMNITNGLTVGGAKNTSITTGLVTGGKLTKQDNGTLTLSGTNTYTGNTTITGGTLQFAKTASLYNSTTGSWTAANIKVNAGTLALNVGGAGEFTSGNVTTLLTNLGGINGTSANGFAAGSKIGFDTTNAGGSFTVGDVIANSTGSGGGAVGLTKLGTGALVLSNTSTYSGATIVSAGTLFVAGTLSNSNVTVQANGTLGSNGAFGTLGSGLTIAAGGNLDLTGAILGLNSTNILSLTGGSLTLGNLTFQDLLGWDWANASVGTYKLIDGSFDVDFGSTAHLTAGTAYDFGNGKTGYFTSGSLNAVIVAIPEPGAALLAGLGLLALLRRRRA